MWLKAAGVYILFLTYFANAQSDEPATDVDNLDLLDMSDIEEESERDFYPTDNTLALCGECSCPSTPQCDPGISLVLDGCGCCKICASQLGQKCDSKNVCDHHKGLHCDENTKTCKARPGRSCRVADKWYDNGALFSPSCRITCSCIDGDLGCVSKCKPAPQGCRYPRLVRSSSNCCGHWRCSNRPTDSARGRHSTVEFRGSCMIQTTNWSPCTKTCGFGISERVTNDNDQCKLTKETRLCILRPCKGTTTPRKSKRSCRKSLRHNKRIRYSINGCPTVKTYRPKYCGTCRHSEKCCKPHTTRTVDMEFRCSNPDGSLHIMTRKMMMIQNCICGNFCSRNENDIFSNSVRLLGNDIFHSIR